MAGDRKIVSALAGNKAMSFLRACVVLSLRICTTIEPSSKQKIGSAICGLIARMTAWYTLRNNLSLPVHGISYELICTHLAAQRYLRSVHSESFWIS